MILLIPLFLIPASRLTFDLLLFGQYLHDMLSVNFDFSCIPPINHSPFFFTQYSLCHQTQMKIIRNL